MTPVASPEMLARVDPPHALIPQRGHATFRSLIDVGWKIEVSDPDGTVVETRECAGGDLATNNFLNWMVAMFTGFVNGATNGTFAATNTSGVAKTLGGYASDGAPNKSTFNTGKNNANTVGNNLGLRVVIGDGNGSTVTPARTDTALARLTATSPYMAAPTLTTNIVTIAYAFVNGTGSNWTGSTAIREVGLQCDWFDNISSTGATSVFLLFHDAVAATTVNIGQTITVTYTITFP